MANVNDNVNVNENENENDYVNLNVCVKDNDMKCAYLKTGKSSSHTL